MYVDMTVIYNETEFLSETPFQSNSQFARL